MLYAGDIDSLLASVKTSDGLFNMQIVVETSRLPALPTTSAGFQTMVLLLLIVPQKQGHTSTASQCFHGNAAKLPQSVSL